MSLYNALVPADTEAVKLGVQRIREVKATLNATNGLIFNDDGSFRDNFVTGAMIKGDPTVSANRAISSLNIQDSAIITSALSAGVLSADAAGRSKMADGYLSSLKLANDFVLPDGNVGTNQIADGAVTLAKLAVGAATHISIGTYAGSNSTPVDLSTALTFAPDILIFTGGPTFHDTALAIKVEASGSVGPAHALFATGAIGGSFTGAIEWDSLGFKVLATGVLALNSNGKTHTYIAIKV